MSVWEIVRGPRAYEPSGGEDAERGWAWDLRRGGEERTVRVEVSGTAAAVVLEALDDEARRAIQSQGRSAVKLWLGEDELPERIVIHTQGVTRPGG